MEKAKTLQIDFEDCPDTHFFYQPAVGKKPEKRNSYSQAQWKKMESRKILEQISLTDCFVYDSLKVAITEFGNIVLNRTEKTRYSPPMLSAFPGISKSHNYFCDPSHWPNETPGTI